MSPQRRFDGSLLRRNLPRRTHDHGAKTGMRMAPRTPTDGLAALALNRRRRAKIRNGAAPDPAPPVPAAQTKFGARKLFSEISRSLEEIFGVPGSLFLPCRPGCVCCIGRRPPQAYDTGMQLQHALQRARPGCTRRACTLMCTAAARRGPPCTRRSGAAAPERTPLRRRHLQRRTQPAPHCPPPGCEPPSTRAP
jgi:hypothetical protein